eukprot:g28262.t2
MCRYRCLLVASVAACLALDSMFPAFAGASAKQRQCRAVMLASDEEALAETRATIGRLLQQLEDGTSAATDTWHCMRFSVGFSLVVSRRFDQLCRSP